MAERKPSNKKNGKNTYKKCVPYQALATIYNDVMNHVNYENWAEYIKSIIHISTENSGKLLDIGCGTGELIFELQQLDIKADGCDPSDAMLEIAKSRNPSSAFWTDRLPELDHSPPQQYQVITCLYDTINYLSSLHFLEMALQRIFYLLPPGGLFIFDVVSGKLCQKHFHKVREQEVINQDYAYIRKSYYKQDTDQQINDFSIYTPHGIFKERHIQQIFPFREIRNLIVETNRYDLIGIYQDFTFLPASEESNRANFVLKKNKI
jgi:SAM-dependent methyltransferase